MKTILLVALMVSCTPAPAIELVSGVVMLTPVEQQNMALCATQGGCRIVSVAMLQKFIDTVQEQSVNAAAEVAAQAIEDAKKTFTCRRDMI